MLIPGSHLRLVWSGSLVADESWDSLLLKTSQMILICSKSCKSLLIFYSWLIFFWRTSFRFSFLKEFAQNWSFCITVYSQVVLLCSGSTSRKSKWLLFTCNFDLSFYFINIYMFQSKSPGVDTSFTFHLPLSVSVCMRGHRKISDAYVLSYFPIFLALLHLPSICCFWK